MSQNGTLCTQKEGYPKRRIPKKRILLHLFSFSRPSPTSSQDTSSRAAGHHHKKRHAVSITPSLSRSSQVQSSQVRSGQVTSRQVTYRRVCALFPSHSPHHPQKAPYKFLTRWHASSKEKTKPRIVVRDGEDEIMRWIPPGNNVLAHPCTRPKLHA
jgi:hypothetical protein